MRAGGLGVVVFADDAGRAPTYAVDRGSSLPTPCQVKGCGFKLTCTKCSGPVACGQHAHRPVHNRPTARAARARWRTWRGWLYSQRGARSNSRRRLGLFFTDTVPDRRQRLRSAVAIVFQSRGALPACASPRGEPNDHPRSVRGLADLAWLSSLPTRGALHPTPLAKTLRHRHRARSAAVASNKRGRSLQIPWRTARARFAPCRTGQPPTKHARAGDRGVVIFAANAGALHPTPLDETLLHQHPARSAAVAAKRRDRSNRTPCRAARARCAPWGTSRPPTEHVRDGGLGVVVFAANTGRAPPHAVKRGSLPPTPRQAGDCGCETT